MSEFRSGFVTFVGRPNVGKSTLTNTIVGSKVAITSSKPQTTRKAIRGIKNLPEGQLVMVDTPGVHKPRTLLGQRLNSLVEQTLGEVDLVAFCSPANEKIGPGDKRIVDEILELKRPKKIAIVTKTDSATREEVASHLLEVSNLAQWDEIIPVSALTGEQIDLLTKILVSHLPVGPELYPKGMVSEEETEETICELIREAALEGLNEELPHSLAVTLDEIVDGGRPEIFVSLWVERDSQKGIIIGKGGANLKQIGIKARSAIENLLGEPVTLRLQVKVSPNWQRDAKRLGRLGF